MPASMRNFTDVTSISYKSKEINLYHTVTLYNRTNQYSKSPIFYNRYIRSHRTFYNLKYAYGRDICHVLLLTLLELLLHLGKCRRHLCRRRRVRFSSSVDILFNVFSMFECKHANAQITHYISTHTILTI